MTSVSPFLPDGVPVLSRGKHRNAKRGACFMEFASYLAGESWSDRPKCTHPALASLARLVNDWSSDAARGRLAGLVPSVIGLTGDDEATDLVIAILAASAALPIASESRQRVLALGLIKCVARIAETEPASTGGSAARSRAIAVDALRQVPLATAWARTHASSLVTRGSRSDVPMCDALVGLAVAGIGEACVDDRDERLRDLLAVTIVECERRLRPASVAPPLSALNTPMSAVRRADLAAR